MEPVSTTLGVLGLGGLLHVCLECFHRIQDGRSLGQDFAFLEGQLSAHRIRLYAWAHVCGLTRADGRYDPRLDSPIWQQHIRNQLNAIALLFLDADKIVQRYEFEEHQTPGGQTNAVRLLESSNTQFVNSSLRGYLSRLQGIKKQAGILDSLAWAFRHKRDFNRLVLQLRECIEALELVSKNLDLFEIERRVVKIEIERVRDVEVLHNMIGGNTLSLSDVNSDVVSDAASQRLNRMVENKTGSVWGSSNSGTFVTAPTRPDTDL